MTAQVASIGRTIGVKEEILVFILWNCDTKATIFVVVIINNTNASFLITIQGGN